MCRIAVMFTLGACIVCCAAPQAAAIVAFKREFQKLYITPDTEKEFADTVKSNRTGCFVCHQGKNRKNHNAYGIHLVELLDKKEDIKDTKKIIAALRKVEKMHTDPEDEESPTYGDLIKENKLPGGPIEEAMKEPEGEKDEALAAPGDAPSAPGEAPSTGEAP